MHLKYLERFPATGATPEGRHSVFTCLPVTVQRTLVTVTVQSLACGRVSQAMAQAATPAAQGMQIQRILDETAGTSLGSTPLVGALKCERDVDHLVTLLGCAFGLPLACPSFGVADVATANAALLISGAMFHSNGPFSPTTGVVVVSPCSASGSAPASNKAGAGGDAETLGTAITPAEGTESPTGSFAGQRAVDERGPFVLDGALRSRFLLSTLRHMTQLFDGRSLVGPHSPAPSPAAVPVQELASAVRRLQVSALNVIHVMLAGNEALVCADTHARIAHILFGLLEFVSNPGVAASLVTRSQGGNGEVTPLFFPELRGSIASIAVEALLRAAATADRSQKGLPGEMTATQRCCWSTVATTFFHRQSAVISDALLLQWHSAVSALSALTASQLLTAEVGASDKGAASPSAPVEAAPPPPVVSVGIHWWHLLSLPPAAPPVVASAAGGAGAGQLISPPASDISVRPMTRHTFADRRAAVTIWSALLQLFQLPLVGQPPSAVLSWEPYVTSAAAIALDFLGNAGFVRTASQSLYSTLLGVSSVPKIVETIVPGATMVLSADSSGRPLGATALIAAHPIQLVARPSALAHLRRLIRFGCCHFGASKAPSSSGDASVPPTSGGGDAGGSAVGISSSGLRLLAVVAAVEGLCAVGFRHETATPTQISPEQAASSINFLHVHVLRPVVCDLLELLATSNDAASPVVAGAILRRLFPAVFETPAAVTLPVLRALVAASVKVLLHDGNVTDAVSTDDLVAWFIAYNSSAASAIITWADYFDRDDDEDDQRRETLDTQARQAAASTLGVALQFLVTAHYDNDDDERIPEGGNGDSPQRLTCHDEADALVSTAASSLVASLTSTSPWLYISAVLQALKLALTTATALRSVPSRAPLSDHSDRRLERLLDCTSHAFTTVSLIAAQCAARRFSALVPFLADISLLAYPRASKDEEPSRQGHVMTVLQAIAERPLRDSADIVSQAAAKGSALPSKGAPTVPSHPALLPESRQRYGDTCTIFVAVAGVLEDTIVSAFPQLKRAITGAPWFARFIDAGLRLPITPDTMRVRESAWQVWQVSLTVAIAPPRSVSKGDPTSTYRCTHAPNELRILQEERIVSHRFFCAADRLFSIMQCQRDTTTGRVDVIVIVRDLSGRWAFRFHQDTDDRVAVNKPQGDSTISTSDNADQGRASRSSPPPSSSSLGQHTYVVPTDDILRVARDIDAERHAAVQQDWEANEAIQGTIRHNRETFEQLSFWFDSPPPAEAPLTRPWPRPASSADHVGETRALLWSLGLIAPGSANQVIELPVDDQLANDIALFDAQYLSRSVLPCVLFHVSDGEDARGQVLRAAGTNGDGPAVEFRDFTTSIMGNGFEATADGELTGRAPPDGYMGTCDSVALRVEFMWGGALKWQAQSTPPGLTPEGDNDAPPPVRLFFDSAVSCHRLWEFGSLPGTSHLEEPVQIATRCPRLRTLLANEALLLRKGKGTAPSTAAAIDAVVADAERTRKPLFRCPRYAREMRGASGGGASGVDIVVRREEGSLVSIRVYVDGADAVDTDSDPMFVHASGVPLALRLLLTSPICAFAREPTAELPPTLVRRLAIARISEAALKRMVTATSEILKPAEEHTAAVGTVHAALASLLR